MSNTSVMLLKTVWFFAMLIACVCGVLAFMGMMTGTLSFSLICAAIACASGLLAKAVGQKVPVKQYH